MESAIIYDIESLVPETTYSGGQYVEIFDCGERE